MALGWRRLTVQRDRFGVQPLFWNATPTSVRISPSIDALLAAGAPAELDDAAMAVFLRIGFFVGDDTPFAAIRALPRPVRSVDPGSWRRHRRLVAIPAPLRHLTSGGGRPVRGLLYRRDRARRQATDPVVVP
jgi:asparagine synthetase B (glutamine-hydrolysing)